MGSGLAQRPTEKPLGFPLVLPLSSTKTHHNLSINVAAQSTDVTFTAQQEKQWLQELPPTTDPLVPSLVLQVHLRLATAVGRLVLLARGKLQQREAENTAGKHNSTESSRAKRKEERTLESDVSWQCHIIAGNASSSLACQREKIPLRKVGRISLWWTGMCLRFVFPKRN